MVIRIDADENQPGWLRDDEQDETEEKSWVPYQGPQGGQGWRNTDTDEVIYQDEPPGELMSPEEFVEAAQEAGFDPEEVQEVADQLSAAQDAMGGEQGENKAVEAARNALEQADTSGLDESEVQNIQQRIEHDAANAKSPEIAEKLYGHVGEWRYTDGTFDSTNKGRASCKVVAKHGGSPDAKATINVAPDEDDRTITHETAHAFLDSFAYNNPRGTGISHAHPSQGIPDWDFGPDGEHGPKKEYMLTHYGDYEERGFHGWDEYEERGDPVDSPDELEIGDRVAVNTSTNVVEGAVRRNDRPIRNAKDVEPGDEISLEDAEMMVSAEGRTLTGRLEDRDNAEVVHSLANNEAVFVNDGEVTALGPEEYREMAEERGGQLDAEGHLVGASLTGSVIAKDDEGNVFKADPTDITDAPDVPEYAVVDRGTGEYQSIDEETVEDTRLMASKGDRDWVPAGHLRGETLNGESVRFAFGASDEVREGVVVRETDSQMTIEYEEDGETDRKTINKSQAYNQQVWIADDRGEFAAPEPSSDPPGYQEARYEMMDLTEADVDWDTSVQYNDPEERMESFDTGDLVLLRDPDGDRHTIRVTDHFEGFAGDSEEIQGNFGNDSEFGNTGDAHTRVEVGPGGDWDVMGTADQSQFVDPGTGETAEPEPNYLKFGASGPDVWDNFEKGDEVRMTDPKTGERTTAQIYPDPVDDNVYTVSTDIHNRYVAVEEDGQMQLMTPGATEDQEWHGPAGGFVTGVREGTRLDGGFTPHRADDLDEGMLLQYRDDEYASRTGQIESVGEGSVVLDDGTEVDIDNTVKAAHQPGQQDDGDKTLDQIAEDLVTEVNKAWHKMVTRNERGLNTTKFHVGTSYSETNPHETFAKLHETMQLDDRKWAARGVVEQHPDLMVAYSEAFEPADGIKEALNELHEESPYKTPWREKPYPEVEQ